MSTQGGHLYGSQLFCPWKHRLFPLFLSGTPAMDVLLERGSRVSHVFSASLSVALQVGWLSFHLITCERPSPALLHSPHCDVPVALLCAFLRPLILVLQSILFSGDINYDFLLYQLLLALCICLICFSLSLPLPPPPPLCAICICVCARAEARGGCLVSCLSLSVWVFL